MFRLNAHIWIVWLLCAGALSEEDTSGCEGQPCQNGGVCESHNGSFRCLCSQQSLNGRLYGGHTCTVALSGCDENHCENGGICSPLLVNDEHTYTCICLAGFMGQRCQTHTVFSFETSGYVLAEISLRDPVASINVTFSFRTEQPVGTLLQRRVEDLLLSIDLMDGRLRLTSLRGQGSSTLVQELPDNVSDNRWYTVEASLGGVVSLIRLVCTDGGCSRGRSQEVQLLEQGLGHPGPGLVRQRLLIGAAGVGEDYLAPFRGCFRDVFVESMLVVPTASPADSLTQVNVTVGCSDQDKCEDGPCENRGRCVSHGWRSYECECHRPYEGTNCAEEYITARFGDADSYAAFSLDDHPGETLSVSMFIRTRQSGGLLLVLANGTGHYLRLWLEGGRVKVQADHPTESLTGRDAINDGHFHLVTLRLEGDRAALTHSGQTQGSVSVGALNAQPGDLVYVGGLPDTEDAASFGGNFKGCVQDLRVNSKRLQFYSLAMPVESYSLEELRGVTPGCGSDDACKVNPCLNGGVCYTMWDDFTCNCPPNTAGRRCEVVRWCELSPCPPNAVCQLLHEGFECLSNVTFGVNSSVLSYRGNGKIRSNLGSVALSLRTRQSDATLLHAEKGSDYVTVSLSQSHVVLELQAGGHGDAPKLTVQSPGEVGDGRWHTVELRMESQTEDTSSWTVVVDGKEASMSNTTHGNLDFLREGVDLHVGGLGTDAGGKFSGCLGPVLIGGLVLSPYEDTMLTLPRPQDEQFVKTPGGDAPRYGCWGGSVCDPDPCHNGGVCEDLFDLSRCRCPSEWAGSLCQEPVDACASGPCVHGGCSVLSAGYSCACEPGYGGDRCETDVDVCEGNKCSQGATCLRGFLNYTCLCPQNTTGQLCHETIPEIPWYIDVIPPLELPVSECVGSRWNYHCFNGGNCSAVDACDCLPGFTGQWCEKDIDECLSDPCMNGAFCLNYQNRFECVCDQNYSGHYCQIDINDFYLYLFLSLWQNMFQLLSFLILRLDDGPEVDWGFDMED